MGHHAQKLNDIVFADPDARTNNNLSISISLFEDSYLKSIQENYEETYNDIYTKKAIWSAMSFLWNSDLGSNGVKVYFHIEDKIKDIVEPYLQSQNVSDEYIRTVELPESFAYNSEMNASQLGKKMMWIFDDEIDSRNVLSVEHDAFFCSKETRQIYRDLTSPIMANNIGVIEFQYLRINYCAFLARCVKASGLSEEFLNHTSWIVPNTDINISKNIIKPAALEQSCFEKMGLKYKLKEIVQASNYVLRPYINSSVLQIPADHNFIDASKEFAHRCYDIDYFLSMYYCSSNSTFINLSDILGLHILTSPSHFNSSLESYIALYANIDSDLSHECYSDFYLSMMQILHNAR